MNPDDMPYGDLVRAIREQAAALSEDMPPGDWDDEAGHLRALGRLSGHALERLVMVERQRQG